MSGETRRGYLEVVKELNERFPDVDEIETEQDKKEFSKLFGEYLRIENILQNYDEYANLKALQEIDLNDGDAVETFKNTHFVTDDDILNMRQVEILPDRKVQDYKTTYGTGVEGSGKTPSRRSQKLTGTMWFLRLICSSRRR